MHNTTAKKLRFGCGASLQSSMLSTREWSTKGLLKTEPERFSGNTNKKDVAGRQRKE